MKLFTLIPAYRVTFVDEAISSSLSQTKPPDKVIVSDDSPDGSVLKHVQRQWTQVTVIEGPKRGCIRNIRNAFEEAEPEDGDLIHVLLDDDLISQTFYESHYKIHLANKIEASFSDWRYLHLNGTLTANRKIRSSQHGLISGYSFIRSVLKSCNNWAGPLTSMVFRASVIRDCLLMCRFRSSSISYYGCGDIGTLLDCAEHGDVFVSKESIAYHRLHSDQQSKKKGSHAIRCLHLAWAAIVHHMQERGVISSEYARVEVMRVARRARMSGDCFFLDIPFGDSESFFSMWNNYGFEEADKQ